MVTIAIAATTEKLLCLAQNLAQRLSLPFISVPLQLIHNFSINKIKNEKYFNYDFLLIFTSEHLELKEISANHKAIFVDFLNGKTAYRYTHGGGYNQIIAKAVGVKKNLHLTVLDATAGLGQDAFVLASLGCEVLLIEKSPIIAALLTDGLDRAKNFLIAKTIKMTLLEDDSINYIRRLTVDKKPDIIYLDPMYPQRTKSALVKKELRIIRAITGDDIDSSELLAVALNSARKRVVVKRPRLAPSINNIKPEIKYEGSCCRFDVYIKAHN